MDAFTILPGTVSPTASKPALATDGPAVATPEVTIPSVDATIEKIKARLAGKAAPVTRAAPPPETPPKADETPGDTEDAKTIPPKVLAELGRLQKQVREFEPKVKEFDTIKTEAEMVREIKKLWSGTPEEKIQALAKISGKDGLDEFAGLLKTYYNLEQNGEGGEEIAPGVKAISDKLEAALKVIDELKADRAKEKEEGAKKVSESETEQSNKHVAGFIEKHKATFEICARPENSAEAVDLIQSAAIAILDRDKIDVKTMTQEQAEKAYLEAAERTERAFEETGKRLSKGIKVAPEKDLSRFDRFVRTPSKPAVVAKPEVKSKNPDEAFAALRARLTSKLEAGEFARR